MQSARIKVLQSAPKPEGAAETLVEAIKILEKVILESDKDDDMSSVKKDLMRLSKSYYSPVRMSTGTVYDSDALKFANTILVKYS